MLKKECPMGRYLYIMRQKASILNPNPNHDWLKIGILTYNENTQGTYLTDDRRRMMAQSGSIMETDRVYYLGTDKGFAEKIERQIHKNLKKDGYNPMQDLTNTTGHSEWFNITVDEASKYAEMVLEFRIWMFDTYPESIISKELFENEKFKKQYWNRI